jgi:hypothetical protein
MAISITSKPNTSAPSSDFPLGNIKDRVGANPGTPVNTEVYGDFHQFFAQLMQQGGVTPNNVPDNEYSGYQLIEGLIGMFGGIRRKVVPIGSWNMQSPPLLLVVPTLIPFAQLRGYSFLVINDSGENSFTNGIIGGLAPEADAFCGAGNELGNVSLVLTRRAGGGFDDSSFSGSANRGYIIVEYDPS